MNAVKMLSLVMKYDLTYSGLGHSNPAGHVVQLVALFLPNVVVPIEQRTGVWVLLGHMYPTGQSVQLACPSKE